MKPWAEFKSWAKVLLRWGGNVLFESVRDQERRPEDRSPTVNQEDKVNVWLGAFMAVVLGFLILCVSKKVDSIRNCQRACGDRMASYTETYSGPKAVPICTCAEEKKP